MNRYALLYVTALVIACVVCSGAAQTTRVDYPFGFAPGTRVVLLADAPELGEGLTTGRAGTIVCCDAAGCSGSLLVSWDLFTGGTAEQDRCATSPVGISPAGSATWVDPNTVMLGRPFDEMGILQETEDGCWYLGTEDGKLYHLVIDPAFFEQWPVVMSGNRVRLRGLLNTSAVEQACSQRDGDLYHPIMTASDWTGESCCDPFVCGFKYGDRVVLIGEDDPNGAVGLPRGSSGTIICCNSRAATNSVLVSWNLWPNGGDANDYILCNERLAGLFPPGSTWWVPVEDLAKEVTTECGTLQEVRICENGECTDVAGVALFIQAIGLYYLPDLTLTPPLPEGQFRASGLFAPYASLPEGVAVSATAGVSKTLAGTIFHSVLLPCLPAGCCVPPYSAGDRVVLLVDEPGGAKGLFAGAAGTVVCCNADDPNTPIFVSWDFWMGGNDDDENCTCCERPLWYPETSGWWMACKEIEPIVLPDLYDVGEDYRGFAPSSVTAGVANQGLIVSGLIANRGGQESGAFFVDIYASTDTEITTADYFVGVVAMDIEAGGSADLYWAGDFPTDVPAGTYNIGWIIDPDNLVKEANEKNNTAVVEAGQLVVQ